MIEVSRLPKFGISCRNVRLLYPNLTLTRVHTINQKPRSLLFTLLQLVDTKSYPPHLAIYSCSETAALIWSLDPQFQWHCVQLCYTSTSSYSFFGSQGTILFLYGTICCLKSIWKFRLQVKSSFEIRHLNVKTVLTYRCEELIFLALFSSVRGTLNHLTTVDHVEKRKKSYPLSIG